MISVLAYLAIFGSVCIGTYVGIGMYRRYRGRFLARAEEQLEELYSPLTPQQLWLLTLLGVALLGLAGVLLVGPNLAVAGIAVVVGFALPRLYVRTQTARRLRQFDAQLVDALVLIANSLKSGMNLAQALDTVTKQMGPPISQEFGLAIKENRLGTPLDDVLVQMTRRLASEDLRITIDAMLIARETGGSLAETFDRIAATIRERSRVRGRLDSLTSTGRMQGIVMSLLPWFLAGVLYLVDPNMMRPMFEKPLGQVLLVVVVVLEGFGWLFIRRILAIDI